LREIWGKGAQCPKLACPDEWINNPQRRTSFRQVIAPWKFEYLEEAICWQFSEE